MQANSSSKKLWDYYAITPNAPIYKKEFGFYVLDRWIDEGYLKPREQEADYSAYLLKVFGLDEPAVHHLQGLGWCEAAFMPRFE